MMGAGLTIPITKGRLNMGTWQVGQGQPEDSLSPRQQQQGCSLCKARAAAAPYIGCRTGACVFTQWAPLTVASAVLQGIWLCEHRDHGGSR